MAQPALLRFVNRSLRVKVALGAVLPLVLVLGIFTTLEGQRNRTTILDRLSLLAAYSATIIQSNLRHEMEEVDPDGIRSLFNNLRETEQFRVVYVLDPSGRIIFGAGGEPPGTELDSGQADCLPCHDRAPELRPESLVVTTADGDRVFRSMLPIENGETCRPCHDSDQRLLGVILTDIPTEPLEKELAAELRENLLWWAAAILVTVAVLTFATRRVVVDRLQRIGQTLTRFGEGARHLRVPTDSPDEIGRLAEAFNAMSRGIEFEGEQNRALSTELRRRAALQQDLLRHVITAQENERRRIAWELHDDFGQDLAALAVNVEVVQQLWPEPPAPVRNGLQQIHTSIGEMISHAYAWIRDIRPPALDDLGLVPALRALADRVLQPENLVFELDVSSLEHRLPSEIETALFRTLQEAFSNIVRHSGAGRVQVSLAVRSGVFEGEVVDDGCGFDPKKIFLDGSDSKGLGILGMQERVMLCGGTLEILSQPPRGTRIRIRIPLAARGESPATNREQ